jgi:NAD(P)-dependent dehydrogenase (short-subunit alcohol dehydrogenase family)
MSNKKLDALFKLDGKVIVITGATGLLGRKHAEAIAAYGGTPILLDIYEDSAIKLADELNVKYSVSAIGMSVDVTNEQAIIDNCNKVIDLYGKIDGLVNNAANNPKVEQSKDINFSRLENFSLDIWNQDINVGLTGAFLCAKHYGSQIANNPGGGVIVNISSDLGMMAPDQRLYKKDDLPNKLQPVKPVTYSVVKTGIIGLTRYLSTYWVDKKVRSNAICPGGVENGQSEEFIEDVSFRIPMNRLARADEYQGVLLWMLSDASSYLNGAIVPVDGGRTAW